MKTPIQYHTDGKRGFLLEADFTTIGELVVPGARTPAGADAGPIVASIVHRVNKHDELVQMVARLAEYLEVASGDDAYHHEILAAQVLVDSCEGGMA